MIPSLSASLAATATSGSKGESKASGNYGATYGPADFGTGSGVRGFVNSPNFAARGATAVNSATPEIYNAPVKNKGKFAMIVAFVIGGGLLLFFILKKKG